MRDRNYRYLENEVWKLSRKSSFWKPRRRWENAIKIQLQIFKMGKLCFTKCFQGRLNEMEILCAGLR